MYDLKMIEEFYSSFGDKVDLVKEKLKRPLTFTEKVLFGHIDSESAINSALRGASYEEFNPDRVAMQDATAQMALLQFMQAGRKKVAVPSTAHADHLIQAKIGADKDLQEGINQNNEVFNFLSSTAPGRRVDNILKL